MIQSLAPTLRRGCSWAWLGLLLAALIGRPASAPAQDTKKGGEAAPKKSDAPAAKADEAKKDAAKAETPDEGESDVGPVKGADPIEVFKDERAEKALEVFKSV